MDNMAIDTTISGGGTIDNVFEDSNAAACIIGDFGGGGSLRTSIVSSDIELATVELSENVTIDNIPLEDFIKKEASMSYLTAGNILLIIMVTIVTVKWIIPRLNIKWMVQKFKNFIHRPFKKGEKEVKVAWGKAKKEAKEEWKENREGGFKK